MDTSDQIAVFLLVVILSCLVIFAAWRVWQYHKQMRRKKETGILNSISEDIAKDASLAVDTRDNEFVPARGKAPKNTPTLDKSTERIVERVYNVPTPLVEYEALENALTVGEQRSDYSSLSKALDVAEDNARRAHKLYLVVRQDRKRWDTEKEIITAPMRSNATYELEREKKDGSRTKQITDADVLAKMAALYPDEFEHFETRAAKLKGMEEHILLWVDLWKSRCGSLQTMVRGLRR